MLEDVKVMILQEDYEVGVEMAMNYFSLTFGEGEHGIFEFEKNRKKAVGSNIFFCEDDPEREDDLVVETSRPALKNELPIKQTPSRHTRTETKPLKVMDGRKNNNAERTVLSGRRSGDDAEMQSVKLYRCLRDEYYQHGNGRKIGNSSEDFEGPTEQIYGAEEAANATHPEADILRCLPPFSIRIRIASYQYDNVMGTLMQDPQL
ncbi:hypothetical protein FGB62_50g016 [Gracilaria domingensis]|nr:hypothetical protein FGB62_50g016 [Gracilaria domingensis]